ncbi:MAG TPA: YbaK/EbsC family protein [Candidatus Eisenbacteria bacterium]|nr:YbaK/EbsC family protein [Candidatus Eisenbacteria bacterium]
MYHQLVTTIQDLLKEHAMWFETFEHEPVKTSEEAAQLRTGYTIKQGAKALLLRIKPRGGQKKFIMCVLPGDRRLSSSRVKVVTDAKEIRFATQDEVYRISGGVVPGGVPPFGNLFGLDVYVDRSLLENEKIVFNAGDRRFSIAMLSSDYQKLVNPIVKSFI